MKYLTTLVLLLAATTASLAGLAGCRDSEDGEPRLPPRDDPASSACELGSAWFAEQGPQSAAELEEALAVVRERLYPELVDIEISMANRESEDGYFEANLDPTSVLESARKRRYVIRYAEAFLVDGPAGRAALAVLAHEMRHIADYVTMDTLAFLDFGLGYALADVAAYERYTDEWVVQLGCGEGLKAYRVWMYEHLDPELVAEKRRVYMTPDEIDALMAALEAP